MNAPWPESCSSEPKGLSRFESRLKNIVRTKEPVKSKGYGTDARTVSASLVELACILPGSNSC